MRRKISLYSTILATLSMVSFIGCESANNTTSDNRPTVTAENFTTQGKPTKTVQTPWGDKQVYDPTQDPEIIEAFEYVKNIHQQYGPNAKYDELKRYDILFSQIRNIQYLDMGRLGCQKIDRPTCGYSNIDFSKNQIGSNCSNLAFGSPILNKCERENSSLEKALNDPIALGQINPPACGVSKFGDIGSEYRRNAIGRDETASDYFGTTCNKY